MAAGKSQITIEGPLTEARVREIVREEMAAAAERRRSLAEQFRDARAKQAANLPEEPHP